MHEERMGTRRLMRDTFEKEINLKEIYKKLKNKWWLIVACTAVLGLLAGLYNSKPETPLYSATSRIIISADSNLLGTLKVVLREPIVLEKVVTELGLNRSTEALRNQIQVSSVEGSLITLITVVDPDPLLAAHIANTIVGAYQQEAASKLNFTNINVLSEAEIKSNPMPINSKSNRIVYIASFLGLLMGIGLTFILHSLDDSIRTERDIEQRLELTMLGQVSKIRRKDTKRKKQMKKNLALRGETIGS